MNFYYHFLRGTQSKALGHWNTIFIPTIDTNQEPIFEDEFSNEVINFALQREEELPRMKVLLVPHSRASGAMFLLWPRAVLSLQFGH